MLPPELVAKLQDCARTNFAATKDTWFFRQTVCEVVVIVGLVFEGPELLHEMLLIIRGESERFKDSILVSKKYVDRAKVAAFIGWIFIIGGLLGEIKASSEIKDLSASIEECSDAKVTKATLEAGDAGTSAKTAHEEADAAKTVSGQAQEKASKAETSAGRAISQAGNALSKAAIADEYAHKVEGQASKASAAASEALTLARSARKEADSFEAKIRSAEEHATEADSHLANAMRRADEAAAELNRIRLPRTLVRETELTVKLEAFIGTKYTFASVAQDEESISFLLLLDSLLQRAGWIRVKPPSGFPAINIYGNRDPTFAVPVGFNSGVGVSVDFKGSLAEFRSTPENKLPPSAAAAVALNKFLSWGVWPTEDFKIRVLSVNEGKDSSTVYLRVGGKP
jgi:hypothetical protein